MGGFVSKSLIHSCWLLLFCFIFYSFNCPSLETQAGIFSSTRSRKERMKKYHCVYEDVNCLSLIFPMYHILQKKIIHTFHRCLLTLKIRDIMRCRESLCIANEKEQHSHAYIIGDIELYVITVTHSFKLT